MTTATSKAINTYHVRQDIVVVDSNPELADYDNPNGDIHGTASYIVATNPEGYRLAHFAQSIRVKNREETKYSLERLQALTDYLNAEQPELNAKHWHPTEPQYGSPAYEEVQPLLAHRERQDALFNESI